jgi:hypothetical protein
MPERYFGFIIIGGWVFGSIEPGGAKTLIFFNLVAGAACEGDPSSNQILHPQQLCEINFFSDHPPTC